MGGLVQRIAVSTEEGLGTRLFQGVRDALFSGKNSLKSYGPAGQFLEEHLGQYEQYKASAASKSKSVVEKIHTNPQQLQSFQRGMINRLKQSGTDVVPSVNEPHVYHPDLAKPNSDLRKQAIIEIRTANGSTQSQASDTISKLVTDQNVRNAAKNMLDPIFPLKTGLLPIKERYMKFGDAVSERVAQNVFFGQNDKALAAIVHTVKENKGRVSASNLADFLDIYLHNTMPGAYRIEGLKHQSAYKSANEAEKLLGKFTSYTMASRIAVPHSVQWVNTLQNSGIKSTLEGLFEWVKTPQDAIKFVKNSGALDEEARHELEISIRGGRSKFEKILMQPGFSWVRKQELKLAALSGKHQALNAAEELLANPSSKDAATILGSLGINHNDVLTAKGLTTHMEETAGFFAADRDMFFRSTRNTPFRWSSNPTWRMITQYKPFAFNMSRMIKENLVRNWERGATPTAKIFNVTKAIAGFAITFPVVGELVSLAENQLLGRQDKPFETDTPFSDKWKHDHAFLDQYLNAFAHVGGFGVAYSLIRATKRRMLANFMLGPASSSLADFAGDVSQGILGKTDKEGVTIHDFLPALRDVTRKIPVVGPGLTRQFIPTKKKTEGFSTRQSTKF